MNYPLELKKYLAKKMAKVDTKCMDCNEQEAYEYHLASPDFVLLEYWLEYYGVFDDSESKLFEELSFENIRKESTN